MIFEKAIIDNAEIDSSGKLTGGVVVAYDFGLARLKAENTGVVPDPASIPWELYPRVFDYVKTVKPSADVVEKAAPAFVDGVLTQQWEARDYTVAELEGLRAQKAKAIELDFTAALAGLEAGYPERERDSWPQQQNEAEKYQADNAASVPLLEAMASARGATVANLVDRILTNAAAYSQLYGRALGTYQGRVDSLDAINIEDPEKTPAEIKAAIDAV